MSETYRVPYVNRPLRATVQVPGSKSITNRALPIAALAEGTTVLNGALFSDDSLYFIGALRRLGYTVDTDEEAKTITVCGAGLTPLSHEKGIDLFVGNSGTTARFLSAFVSLGSGRYRIDGVARMRERPIGDLLGGLRALGVTADDELQTGCPPLLISAAGMAGGVARISGRDSSQFVSALLLAAPYAKKPVEIVVEGELVSAPYVAMTVQMMRQFGVAVDGSEGYYRIEPSRYLPQTYPVEPDASGASYFMAAAALCGGQVTIAGLTLQSLQGDAQFARVLQKMGCGLNESAGNLTITGPADGLKGICVDLFAMSDMVPTLAAIAPFADSQVRILNVANVRLKETDRIHACVTELRKFGVAVEELADGLVIEPCASLRTGVRVATYDDHRMAMAFSILGLRVPDTSIEDPQCTAKTFPDFYERVQDVTRSL